MSDSDTGKPEYFQALLPAEPLPELMQRNVAADDYTDADALKAWMQPYAKRNSHTYRSYRFQAFRFRMFLEAAYGAMPNLLQLAREEDVMAYQDALQRLPDCEFDPSPELLRSYGFGGRQVPFEVPLSRSSLGQCLSVLHAMYEFMRKPQIATGVPYVMANPVTRVRRSVSWAQLQVDRYLPLEALRAMRAQLQAEYEEADSREHQLRNARTELILVLLFTLWLRREEAVLLRERNFVSSMEGWSLKFQRKGGKEGMLPVPDTVMEALKRYRTSMGLPALPGPVSAPVLRPLSGVVSKTLDPVTLYRDIKSLALRTRDALQARVLDLVEDEPVSEAMREHRLQVVCEKLERCSPHWLRHSGATHAINQELMTLETVSKALDHESPALTASMYLHADESSIRKGSEALGGLL